MRARKELDPGSSRSLVCRRGARRPEEQNPPTLGQARNASLSAERPAHRLDLTSSARSVRRGQGGRPDPRRSATRAMQLHLDEIAKDVAPDAMPSCFSIRRMAHVRQLMCRAISRSCPFRQTSRVNPAQNVWEFMGDNWLSNRVFLNADDLLDHCCEAWNKLQASHGASCPSECASGPTGPSHRELV